MIHRHVWPALIVAGIVTGISTRGFAADLPVKALPAAVVDYTWSGLYVGGNVGGAWSSGWSGTQSFSPLAGNIPVTFDHHGSGAIAGGQIGYNWQPTRNWVLGVEADLQWSGLRGGTSFSPLPMGITTANNATMSRDLQWFGTVRGRLGYAWDRWMVYGTGGFAYGQVRYDSALVFTLVTYGPASVRSTETGWTVGGGVEHAFLNDWSAKVEYLYVSLGGQSAVGTPTGVAVPFTQSFDWNHTNFQLVRFALNKKIATW